MNEYLCYTREGRNKELKLQFTFRFRGEPQAGDIIDTGQAKWEVKGRYWKLDGNCVLLIQKPLGRLVHA
jgi:hypothetical protein